MAEIGHAIFTETDVASASTCDIGVPQTRKVNITGTTTITSFGSRANCEKLVRFSGALTLTHNASSLILPYGANIPTQAGDTCIASSDASGNWRIWAYTRAAGAGLFKSLSLNGILTNIDTTDATSISSASAVLSGGLSVALQARVGTNLFLGQGLASTSPSLVINGATTSAFGPTINFERGGVDKGYIGTESAILGNNNDNIVLWAVSGKSLKLYSDGGSLGITIGTAGVITHSAAVTNSSTTTLSGALTYGGVTFNNAVTGSGNLVGSSGPTIAAPTLTGATLVNGAPASAPQLDFSGSTKISVPDSTGSSSFVGPQFGVALVLIRETTLTGNYALLLMGQSTVIILSQNIAGYYVVSATPASGHTGVTWDGSANYKIYNNTGAGSLSYSIATIRGS